MAETETEIEITRGENVYDILLGTNHIGIA
jgi:hypothetical protein